MLKDFCIISYHDFLYFFTAAALSAGAIIIDSSDDEDDDISEVPATSITEANRGDVELTNNNEANKTSSDDPLRSGNCQQTSDHLSSACDAREGEHIVSNQPSTCSMDTKNVSHETDAVEQSASADAAGSVDEETQPNANDDAQNTRWWANSNAVETEVEAEVEIQEPKMRKCRLCPFVSRFRSNLRKHMHGHTGRKKPYKCHICSKYFASPEEVEKHLKFNRHRYRFYCPGCARGFPFANNIIAHEKKCKKSRVYECFMCHFAMHRLSTLEIHMRTHSGHKPYKCDECPKRYAYLNDLNKHLKVHAERNVIQLSGDEN